MPEKTLSEWVYSALGAAGVWMGYLQTNKVSKSTCKALHGEHDKTHIGLCSKMDDMHADVREIRGLLLQHMSNIPAKPDDEDL